MLSRSLSYAILTTAINPVNIGSLSTWMPTDAVNTSARTDYRRYTAHFALDPKWRYLDGPTVTSNELQSAVLCGYVTLKAGVTSVTENSVVFADGTQEEDIDIIVCATGYNYSFPPLKDSVCLSHDNTFQLYRWTFPPSLKPATLAVVGVTPPLGPVFPELEIQSRWAARVFKGLCRLPDSSTMWREVTGRRQDQVEYVTYMDTVATEIGCKPNIAKLLLTDPKLGFHCYFGPATAFQYRLMGPGRWDGAREAVLGSQDRMLYPLKTRYRTEKMDADGERRYGVVALMAVVPLVALVAAVSQWYSAIAVRSL
ncbi:Dimethylaniline monooxygenase [N-oxide-forming] 2 [Lamellibrachia satsuma]|nr:Dimethylaniline monooxygenase [N-oxide-forming] 2 [Lamellibrachia satsuma]